ncbi:MAG: NUDIX domain-containing protein [Candidatus Micrarchaeota archaeon]|nr:NUDIX domain-containing protein [Candidatus Micrarchaeota archaeon]
MKDYSEYTLRNHKGVTFAILNMGRVLLIKRRKWPFIANPGIWTLVQGGREKGEQYLETAYREAKEEVGIDKEHLMLIIKRDNVRLFDAVKKDKVVWENTFFVFHSDTNKVRKNFESSAFRWATMPEIVKEREYTNIFVDKEEITKLIKGAIDASRRLER